MMKPYSGAGFWCQMCAVLNDAPLECYKTLMAFLTELQLSKVATADLLANSEVRSHHEDPRGRGAGGPRVPAAPLGHFTAPHRPLTLLLSGVIHDCGAGGTEIQTNQAGAQSRQLRPKENSWDDGCWHHCR